MIDILSHWLASLPTDEALWILVLVFIFLDVVLGTFRAALNHNLSSTIARQGIMHKIGFIGAMFLCNLIDVAQGVGNIGEMLGYTVPVTALCAAMIITCEVISICESIQAMNPNIDLKFLKGDKGKDMTKEAE